jgi:hypothetical protein
LQTAKLVAELATGCDAQCVTSGCDFQKKNGGVKYAAVLLSALCYSVSCSPLCWFEAWP